MIFVATPEIISKIHESNLYGIFIEMGCGNPISNALCNVEGASKTIYFSENPYSKEFSQNKYGYAGRTVSAETTFKILKTIAFDYANPNINLYFVANFQVGNDNDKSTHGYIGIYQRGGCRKIYHISIHDSKKRGLYIDEIKRIGVNLIYNIIDQNEDSPDFIDQEYDFDLDAYYINLKESIRRIAISETIAFAYIKDGKLYRLEDFLRTDKENLIIYKGSFNPIHLGHELIAEKAVSAYPNSEFCFSISCDTFGKGQIDIEDLLWRIHLINKLGYSVLICNYPLFKSMATIIQQKCNKNIIFPVGYDTFIRIKDIHKIPARFLVIDRDNKLETVVQDNCSSIKIDLPFSSTNIRNKLHDIDFLKTQISSKILDDVISKAKV